MDGWKIATIVLLVIVLAETLFIAWIWRVGSEAIEQENDCIYNVCEGYDTFYFDDYDEVCYCYDQYGEIGKTRYYG